MTFSEFTKTVKALRTYQKQCKLQGSAEVIAKIEELANLVDKELKNVEDIGDYKQLELFD